MARLDNAQAMTFVVSAVAVIISVVSSSGSYDLIDSAVGIIIGLFIFPIFKQPKSQYWRYLVSAVSGLCILLILGFIADYYPTKLNWLHFVIWLVGTILVYSVVPFFETET